MVANNTLLPPVQTPPTGGPAGGGVTDQEAMSALLAAQPGQAEEPVQRKPSTGAERSAMGYLGEVQTLFQAILDELPEMAPAIQKASDMIAEGIEDVFQVGGGPDRKARGSRPEPRRWGPSPRSR